jgi:hypothetical protein
MTLANLRSSEPVQSTSLTPSIPLRGHFHSLPRQLRASGPSKLTSSRVHCPSRHQTTLYQLVRVATHDLPIFAGSWFTLVSVDDEVPRSLVLFPSWLVHEGPFQTRREAGSSATTKTRVFDLLDDPRVAFENDVLGSMPVTALLEV